ncbi:hypothetical protein B0H12DRAFT_1078499 [Mycena haematopus]|nr:hypothetical protein B0H12DRAFT_1078499 [Mycena haematopus]
MSTAPPEPNFLNLPGRDPTLAKLFIEKNHPQRAEIPSGTAGCDNFLGPRAQRTRTRPQKPTNSDGNPTRGPSVGGIAYERTKICKSVQPPCRCYTLGPSAEAPTSIVAPVASAKMPTEEIDADATMRQRVLTSGAVIAVAAFSEVPPIVRERIREVQSLVNFPAIGVSNNYAYATSQANVASAKQPLVPPAGKRGLRKHGKATRPSLATDMGFYGGAHTDRKDSAGHYSHMSANSDLPEGYTPGFFFILELGVFIQLDSHASINFSGLRRHGGTPPLCSSAPGAKLYKFAVSNRIAKGWPATSSCERASFVREGVLMMSQEALVTFIIRSLLLLCYYFLLQLPARYKVRLDPDIFLQSITMQVDGQRVNTGPWEFAPGHAFLSIDGRHGYMVDQDQVRSDAWARWDAWTAVVATHIPSVGHRGPLKHHIPQPLNLKEGDGYDGGDEQEEEDDVSEPELGDPKRRPKPKLRTGPKEGSKKKRAKKVIVEVATEEGESATDLEEGAGVESGGGGQSDSSGSGSTSEPEASNDNNTDLRTKDTDPDTSQDRVLRSGTTFSKGQWRIGEPAESDCDGSVLNASLQILGTMKQLEERSVVAELNRKKRKEISETEGVYFITVALKEFILIDRFLEPQLGKRVRKARVGNTEAVPTPNIWNSESYKNAAAGVTLPHTSELRRSTRTNHAFHPNKWQSVSLQDSDVEGDMIPSRHVAAPLIKCLLQDASLVVIEALNLHAIKRNLHDVETAWEAASQAVATTLDLQELDIAYSALLQHPDASSTTTYFHRFGGVEPHEWPSRHDLAADASRSRIKFKRRLKPGVRAYYPQLLERRADHHTFIASKYGFALASAEFNFSNKRCEILVDNKALLEATTTHTAQIIASWLEFPVGGVSRYQAWFVEAITQTIGLRALLLTSAPPLPSAVPNASATAASTSSGTGILIRSRFMELVRAPAAAPLSLRLEIPDSDSHPQLPDNSTAQALTASALTLPHPAIALYSLSKTPSAPAQQKLAVFMQFLDEALAATRQGHGLTEWQSFMLSNMDRLCPFRELAPSRQRAAGPLGHIPPILQPHRAASSVPSFPCNHIQHRFFSTARMRYTDHEDLASVMKHSAARFTAEHGRNPTPAFFCNSSAYGPHNAGRTVNLAAIYGPLVATENIAAQLASTDAASIPFTAFWDWLRGSVNGRVRFYQLGSLGSYLLAADYTYTNPRLVQPPR